MTQAISGVSSKQNVPRFSC